MSILQLFLFLFPLAYSPGPGNLFFAASGAKFGALSTLPSNVGYHIATWIVTFLIGSGFYSAMQKYPQIFIVIGVIGSLYVFYLAWSFLFLNSINNKEVASRKGVITGALLLIFNPKAYTVIVLMFSQFLTPNNTVIELLWITTLFTLNNFIAFFIWAYIGDILLAKFRDEKYAKKLNIGFSLSLFFVACWILLNNTI